MEIQVFIISWKGVHTAAASIERAARGAGFDTHVVYSGPDPGFCLQVPGGVTRLEDTTYWSGKFDACLRACRGQRMLVIHADTSCDDWPELIRRCLAVMQVRPDIGVWAPRIENAYFNLENAAIRGPREGGLVTVANTDGIVFCLARREVDRMAAVDYARTTFGWGIAWLFCSSAYASGRMAVVDTRVEVRHRVGRGYDSGQALRMALRFLVRELHPRERVQFELLTRYVGRIF